MAGCAVLQKRHRQILEESSTSVSLVSLVSLLALSRHFRNVFFQSSVYHLHSLPSVSSTLSLFILLNLSPCVLAFTFFPCSPLLFSIDIAYVCNSSQPLFTADYWYCVQIWNLFCPCVSFCCLVVDWGFKAKCLSLDTWLAAFCWILIKHLLLNLQDSRWPWVISSTSALCGHSLTASEYCSSHVSS